MLSSLMSAIPVFEPIIVRVMAWIRPDAAIQCETVNALVSACSYIPN